MESEGGRNGMNEKMEIKRRKGVEWKEGEGSELRR